MIEQKDLGTVLSNNSSPSTFEYFFVINKNAEELVKKGMYVVTQNEQGFVLGFLEDIQRANKYLENPESISDYGSKTLAQHFPLEKWDYLVASVSVLGTLKEDRFERAIVPPIPGNPVFKATNKMLSTFLGLDENGLNLGNVFGHNLNLRVNLTRMFQKHLAILAMSGAGKSNLTKVILEELLNRKKGRVAAIVFDIHGEYVGLKEKYDNVIVLESDKIKMAASDLTPQKLKDLFPDMTDTQYSVYYSIHNALRKKELLGLEDIIEAIEERKLNKGTQGALLRYLNELKRFKVVDKVERPDLTSILKPGNVVIVNLVDVSNDKKLQVIAYTLLKKLFSLRKRSVREDKKLIPPTIVFVEEAHNLANTYEKGMAMARREIEKIAREGRKFNLSLCLITQRPSHLSQTALSQCSSQIILRITNPNDLKFIAETSEHVDSRTLKSISGLSVGEGIILGEAVNAPVFVKFRKSEVGKIKTGKTIEEEALEWEVEEDDGIEPYLW